MKYSFFPPRHVVEAVRREFPVGCTVELLEMDDPYRKMPYGMKGTVTAVDDTGTVFANWDNGSTLGVVYGVDKIRRVHKNTRVEYLYRDASNYKTLNSVVVSDEISPAQMREIISCCENGETFIPEQIGWPLLRGWDVTEDDHPYAELDESSFVPTDEEPTIDRSITEILDDFRRCKDRWNPAQFSPVPGD